MKAAIWTLSSVAMVGALTFAVHAHRRADAAEVTLVKQNALRTALDASIQQREADIVANEKQIAKVRATFAKVAPSKPVSTLAPPLKVMQTPTQLIAKDPKLQVLYLAAKRASVASTYGPLFHRLDLSPDQIGRFTAALTRAEEQQHDAVAIQLGQKLPRDDPGLVAFRQRAAADLAAAQLDILGSDGVAHLREYQRALPARAIVDRFAGAAVLAGAALTAPQAEQLVQTLAEAVPVSDSGKVQLTKIDWNKVDARTAEFPTPAQCALFQRIEPLGGGLSRWTARLDRAVQETDAGK